MNNNHSDPSLDVKQLYLLQLTRNALSGIPDKKSDGTGSPSENSHASGEEPREFFLFDYYDKLQCFKGDTFGYKRCFGLEGIEGADLPPVASQFLTLAQLTGEPDQPEIFFYGSKDKRLDKPYLSFILVTIIDKETKETQDSSSTDDIPKFLTACVGEIRSTAEAALRRADDSKNRACVAVYHSLNSGNFCVAIRSNYAAAAYLVGAALRTATFNKDSENGFPPLGCCTFTIAGIELRQDGSGNFCNYNPPKNDSMTKVVLRFAVSDPTFSRFKALLDQIKSSAITLEESMGLYGRYDGTIRITMKQFHMIFPYLCAYKFGEPSNINWLALKTKDNIVKFIAKNLQERHIEIINERLLVDLTNFCGVYPQEEEIRKQEEAKRDERIASVRLQNFEVEEKFSLLLKECNGNVFQKEQFSTCLELIRDIWRTYGNLRFQDDSKINGQMLFAQIRLLLQVIDTFLNSLSNLVQNDADSKQIFSRSFSNLMTFMRHAAVKIESFQKMSQSVNRQSIQSPVYEIQMHMDIEKYLIAYSEFCRMMSAANYRFVKKSNEVDPLTIQQIFPIVTVGFMLRSMNTYALFPLPYTIDAGKLQAPTVREQLIASIEAPGIDVFAKPYKTLPLLCHEMAHNSRPLPRSQRNKVLVEYVLEQVSQYISRQFIARANADKAYYPLGQIETEILIKPIAASLKESFEQEYNFENCNTGALITNLIRFLNENCFSDPNDVVDSSPQIPRYRQIIDCIVGLIKLTQCLDCARRDRILEELSAFEAFSKSVPTDKMEDELAWHLKTLHKETRDLLQIYICVQLEHLRHVYLDLVEKFLSCAKGKSMLTKWRGGQINEPDPMLSQFDYLEAELLKAQILPAFHCDERLFELRKSVREKLDELHKLVCESQDGPCGGQKNCWECRCIINTLQKNLDEAFRTTKQVNLFVRRYMQHVTDLNPENLCVKSVRENLLKRIHYKCHEQLRRIYEEDNRNPYEDNHRFTILLDSPDIQQLLLPLGLDSHTTDIFEKNFVDTLRFIAASNANNLYNPMKPQSQLDAGGQQAATSIENLVYDSVQLYREAFADLGMCACLGLDCFGYLNVVTRATDSEMPAQSAKYDIWRDRVFLVADILLSKPVDSGQEPQNTAMEQFRKELLQYLHNLQSCLAPAESAPFNPFDGWIESEAGRQYIQDILRHLKELEDLLNDKDGALSISDYNDWDNRKLREQLPPEFAVCEKELVYVHKLIARYLDFRNYRQQSINALLKKHFRELYWERMFPGGKCYLLEHTPDLFDKVCEDVGRVYNSGDPIPFLREEKTFKKAVSFVLYYYYHNWKTYYANPESEESVINWLDRLMGGDKK